MKKIKPYRGSHLPVLMKLVQKTRGPIVELGCGMYSTPFLHWVCYPTKRQLVTYENKLEWIDFARNFEADFHAVYYVDDWDKVDFYYPVAVALVDHAPDERRRIEVAKLVNADFVVLHDSENTNDKKYKFSTLHHLFKYRFKYDGAYPFTSIWSNKYDITGFKVD